MATVTLTALNKKQRRVLAEQNARLLEEGKIPPGLTQRDGKLYSPVARCSRCDHLDLVPGGIKPIEAFRVHGSRSNGLSSWCDVCLSSGLDTESAIAAMDLMHEAGLVPEQSVILIENHKGEWLPAASYQYPIDALYRAIARKMSMDYVEKQREGNHLFGLFAMFAILIVIIGVGLIFVG